MKKILLSILALILCVSMFAGCGANNSDAPDAGVPSDSTPTQENNEEVKTIDKKAAIDAFNKIDLASFTGVSVNYMDMLADMVLQADFEMSGIVDGEEGSMSVSLDLKDSIYHMSTATATEDDEYHSSTEVFYVLEGTAVTMYQKYISGETEEGEPIYEWGSYTSDMSEAGATSPATALLMNPDAVNDTIAKIQIPKLEEKDITDVNGMARISNEYILNLFSANVGVFMGEDAAQEDITKAKEDFAESIEKYNLAIYFGINGVGINKMAVGIEEDMNKLYAEIALTDDCLALKEISFKYAMNFGGEGFDYAPETNAVIKPIYAEKASEEDAYVMVGADIDATVYAATNQNWAEDMEYDENGETSDDNIMKSIKYISKIDVDLTLDLSAIGKTNADVIVFNYDQTPDKVIECTYGLIESEDEDEIDNYEIIAAKEIVEEVDKFATSSIKANLKSVNPSQLTLNVNVKQGEVEKVSDVTFNYVYEDGDFTFSGTFVNEDININYSGSISTKDFTMVELPEVTEEY